MPIYRPTELRQFLEELQIRPRKGLSQNFLIDGNIIRKIVDVAGVREDDVVLEVGPGPGSLTEVLLDTRATVLAVEKDCILAEALGRLKGIDRHLEVFCADIMEFSVDKDVTPHLKCGKKAKVVANLPYHLTTPILAHLVTMHDTFSSLVLMVQDEVARRFTAPPGGRDYSSFTVFLNFFSTPHYAFSVGRQCFYPVPNVDSAIVILELKKPPNVSDQVGFFKMTRTAFEHRRKMLRASLKDLYDPVNVTNSLLAIHKNPLSRPEELSLEEFLMLFEKLHH